MRYVTNLKLVIAGSYEVPLPNVKVALYDKDRLTRDDLLGTGTTDAEGEARFEFNTEHFADLDERLTTELPDLYAVVYSANDEKVLSTRAESIPNAPLKRLVVRLDRATAERHGLLPG